MPLKILNLLVLIKFKDIQPFSSSIKDKNLTTTVKEANNIFLTGYLKKLEIHWFLLIKQVMKSYKLMEKFQLFSTVMPQAKLVKSLVN